MHELYPYFTNDGSVGLYSPDVDDIYHSTYGALTEAYEKFIIPSNLNEILKEKKEIKLLDICFGIGYNTKSFLNEVIKFSYNDSIDSDNTNCNDKIDTYNDNSKIYIHAIDNDKNLSLLSPFFVTDKKNIKNNKLPFKQDKISNMLSKECKQIYKLEKETRIIFLELLKEYLCDNNDIQNFITNKKYSKYFAKDLVNYYRFSLKTRDIINPLLSSNAFLHNIYYKYISTSHKKAFKALNRLNIEFKLNNEDAREAIKTDSNCYNLIFLDAFTPVKCPCLWTIDFFKELYNHLEEDGMILTYSNSAQVRNAFLNSGFFVGKIYSDNYKKYSGTIATKKEALIKTHLSEYDLGLIKTKAGIFYRDENLNLSNEAIIIAHNEEVENSNLISSSKFIKQYKKEHPNEEV